MTRAARRREQRIVLAVQGALSHAIFHPGKPYRLRMRTEQEAKEVMRRLREMKMLNPSPR